MIYADYLSTAEMQRWNLDTDIAWDDIDPQLALGQPALLRRVRDSALIESFFPIFTCRAMERLWDDIAATAVFSIQLYESYKHFHVFNQYLHRVGLRADRRRGAPGDTAAEPGLRYEDGTRSSDAVHDERALRGIPLHEGREASRASRSSATS